MFVRSRNNADVADCIAALRTVHDADAYPSSWPEDVDAWLTPTGFLAAWIAVRDSETVGHIAVSVVEGTTVEIQRLFVAPPARGTGIAKMLLDTACNYAISRHLHPMLEVTADREGAIRLYERTGWRRTATAAATWVRKNGERPIVHRYEPPSGLLS